MAKRMNKNTISDTANVIDMRTGRLAKRPALPVICANIRHHRMAAGMDQKELAARLGVIPGTVSKWETGRGRPDINQIPDLCAVLHVTPYQLMGMAEPEKKYSEKELSHLKDYRTLTPGNRYAVDHLTKNLLEVQNAEMRCPRLHVLPYFEKPLAAGIGDPTEYEGASEDLYLHESPDLRRADCVYRVNGDSMTPDFQDGDMVFVQRTADVLNLQPGEIGAFVVGNEFYIKQYEKDGLHSLNPRYPVMRFDDEADARRVFLLGRVLGPVDSKLLASPDEVRDYLLSFDRGN